MMMMLVRECYEKVNINTRMGQDELGLCSCGSPGRTQGNTVSFHFPQVSQESLFFFFLTVCPLLSVCRAQEFSILS